MATAPATLLDALDAHAAARPGATAFRFLATGDHETDARTFGALRAQALALAGALASRAGAGQRALLVYPPGLPFVVGFLACLAAGLVAVPLPAPRRSQSFDKLRAVLDDCGATLVLTDAELAPMLATRLAEADRAGRVALVDTTALELAVPAAPGTARPLPPRDPAALAFLQYTSGSTGTPKGVRVTHAQIVANSRMIERSFAHTPATVMVGWLPMFHDMGLIGTVIQPVFTGFECVLMPPAAFIQKPMRWLRALSVHRGTSSGGPNFGYDLCARKVRHEDLAGVDLSAWRVAFNGAEPVRAATLRAFTAAFAPHGFRAEAHFPCYGLAEATLFVTGGPDSTGAGVLAVDAQACDAGRIEAVGMVGRAAGLTPEDPAPGMREIVSCGVLPEGCDALLRVIDPDSGTALEDDRIGEVCIGGPHVLDGYWQGPLGDKAWTDPASGRTLFRTGDLGFLRHGALHVCGRLKDLVIVAGRNLFPQDLEALVEAAHEAFEPNATAAFTVDVDDQERLVVLQEIRRDWRQRFDDGTGRAQARAALALQFDVALHDIVFVPALTLPKTSSGKIMRRACRTWYLERSADPRATAADKLPDPTGSRSGEHPWTT